MTTLASASLSRHSRSIEPTWLAWFGSGCHMHIAQFVIATFAAVVEPKIRLSHRRDRVSPFVYKASTHIRESIRH